MSLGTGQWMEAKMRLRIAAILGFFTLVISIIIIYALLQSNRASGVTMLEGINTNKILSINKGAIYYVDGFNIIKSNIQQTDTTYELIDEGTASYSISPELNKFYFSKGVAKNSKTYLYSTDDDTKREYGLYDSYFWFGNDLRLVQLFSGTSNILDENLKVQYSKLPFGVYESYSKIILGSINTESPEFQGYKWEVVNRQSAKFKSLVINDEGEISEPWPNGDYLLYNNINDNLVVINNQAEKSVFNYLLTDKNISNGSGSNRYFSDISNGKIIIGNINLNNGSKNIIKEYSLQQISGSIDTKDGISQVLYKDSFLYVVVGGKVLRFDL